MPSSSTTTSEARPPRARAWRLPALVVGALALVASGIGAAFEPDAFFEAYLLALLYWTGIGLGCLSIVMLHHLAGGRWGFAIRRFLEAGAETLWLAFLLSVPIWLGVLLGFHDLYPWARDGANADPLIAHKEPYLNRPSFAARSVFYFGAWIALTFFLTRWSRSQDRAAHPELAHRLRLFSGPGLIVYGLATTFASIDWVMSLEPHWASTIYGLHYIVGHALAAFAFAIILLRDHARTPLARIQDEQLLRDLGNLSLTFVMLWGYMAFSQLLIIWAANLPHKIEWYLSRNAGGWRLVAILLALLHLAVPFFALLSSAVKTRGQRLAFVAGLILVMRWVDLWWLSAPAFHADGLHLHWLDITTTIGMGGVWLAFFSWRLASRPLLPLGDARFTVPEGLRAETARA